MPAIYAGFVDVGYIHAEGIKALGRTANPIAAEVVAWFRDLSAGDAAG